MSRAYVEQRLAEIGIEAKRHWRRNHVRVPRPPKPETPPPRAETIDRIGNLYVAKIRKDTGAREATWFDVAKAYADGFKDAESTTVRRSGDEHG